MDEEIIKEINKRIAKKLHSLRKEVGLPSLNTISKATGVLADRLGKAERDNLPRGLSVSELAVVLDYYNQPISEFLQEIDTEVLGMYLPPYKAQCPKI